MLECPIDYFENNLVFGHDKSCWAFFEMKGFDYDLLSSESKIGLLQRLTLFLANIVSEAKIMSLPVTQELSQNFKTLVAGLDENDSLYTTACNQAVATQTYLEDTIRLSGRANDYKTFVSFKLIREGENEVLTQAKDALDFVVGSVVKGFDAFMALDTADIQRKKLLTYKQLSEEVYLDQSKRMTLLPVDTDTLQWLLRRSTCRGLSQDVQLFRKSSDEAWTPYATEVELAGKTYLRPRTREIANLFNGAIKHKGRALEIEDDGEVSYQTFLTITNIPAELSFPNCEWLYRLQQYNQQAEIYIHVRTVEHREALHKIELQRRTANSQTENINEAGAQIPMDLWGSQQEIEGLEAELKAGKYPLLDTSVVICLAADNRADLEKKAQFIRKEYQDLHFTIERPLADQFSLWMQCLPAVGITVPDFVMKLTPMALASGLFGATHELGSIIGPYIGRTGVESKQVFLDLREACLNNCSASATFYGNLGVGKSFNANLLIYLHVLYGGYGLIIDPKGERSHWATELVALQGQINIATLSPDPMYRGVLDPFNIFKNDIPAACELTVNVVTELFRLLPKDLQYTALLDAIHRIRDELHPSMKRLCELLDEFSADDPLADAGMLLARQIRLLQDSGMSQLLIGTGTENAIQLDNRLNILQIQNLRLPDPNSKKEDYTQEEVVSTVMMMVMAAFARKFIHSHPHHFKICLFDESWILGKTVEGEKLMSYYARMSRSLYAALVLNGHSVTDLPNEGIRNTITYKFCFRTDSSDEARRMLEYLNLELTKENIELIRSLGNGQCLFQDLQGRVGVLAFDAVFSDLIEVFSTTPVDESEQRSKQTEAVSAE